MPVNPDIHFQTIIHPFSKLLDIYLYIIRIISTYRNMRRTIRLKESELRRMISESVKRVLREQEKGYDWSFVEEDPENTKDYENELSWDAKEAADADAKASIGIWDMQDFAGGTGGRIKDSSQYDFPGADYDSGYKKMYGDRDVNDEYFTDSDYYFTNDRWKNSWHPTDRKAMIDANFDKNSLMNRRLKTHESINRKINRIVSECLRRNIR